MSTVYDDVMIDLETLGVNKNAVVVQISGVYFDRETGETESEFCLCINIDSEVEKGFRVDGSTIKWWITQSSEAKQKVFSSNGCDSFTAWYQFNAFLSEAKCIWSHENFDYTLLSTHLEKHGIEPSFSDQYAGRDLRTLIDLSRINVRDFPRVGTAHDGLSDCLSQINYTVAALKILSGRKRNVRKTKL